MEAGGKVAVDIDRRISSRQIDRICIPSTRFVSTDLRRLQTIVGLARAREDRPPAAIKGAMCEAA
jgi:hypothetical protein